MAVNTSQSLGSRVRAARLGKNITLRELARRLEISPAFQTLIERDRSTPGAELVLRIARELSLDADELCGLLGKLTPDVQRTLSKIARTDPKFFRTMVERMKGKQ